MQIYSSFYKTRADACSRFSLVGLLASSYAIYLLHGDPYSYGIEIISQIVCLLTSTNDSQQSIS